MPTENLQPHALQLSPASQTFAKVKEQSTLTPLVLSAAEEISMASTSKENGLAPTNQSCLVPSGRLWVWKVIWGHKNPAFGTGTLGIGEHETHHLRNLLQSPSMKQTTAEGEKPRSHTRQQSQFTTTLHIIIWHR